MNTYYKFAPNVFIAKCTESHEKGEVIPVETKYGKENDSIVFNFIGKSKDGNFFYYSIVRADGFESREWAKRRAKKLQTASKNADKKSTEYWEKSNKDRDFLSLGEPIKVGHHSEKKHRKAFEQADNNMRKSVEFSDKSEEYLSRIEYWASKANSINLSMPESLDFYEFEVDKAKLKHEGLKNGTIERGHSYSLTYAKKELNEAEKKLKIAQRLWA
jgi:hypothetical protein